VVFEDAATTRRAIAGCGHPLTAEELSSAPDSMDETMGELDAAASIPMLWHKGRDFVKGKDAKGKDIKVGTCSVFLFSCFVVCGGRRAFTWLS
jgi:hypothetical protein